MAYTLEDRKHMFWAQCMQMVAGNMGPGFVDNDDKIEEYWRKVNKLFVSGIKRGIFVLPLKSAEEVEIIKPSEEVEVEDNKMKCPGCGEVIPKSWKFHKKCGWELV